VVEALQLLIHACSGLHFFIAEYLQNHTSMNNKQQQIHGTAVHRVLLHFLLQEAKNQCTFLSRGTSFEEDVIDALIAQNQAKIPEEFVDREATKRWWRHVRVAIEFAGLNHYTLAQVLSGKAVEFDSDGFRRSMEFKEDSVSL